MARLFKRDPRQALKKLKMDGVSFDEAGSAFRDPLSGTIDILFHSQQYLLNKQAGIGIMTHLIMTHLLREYIGQSEPRNVPTDHRNRILQTADRG
jgi:hypothetical protein